MAGNKCVFRKLPNEILISIIGRLTSIRDIDSVTRLSRTFYNLFIYHLIDTHISQQAAKDPNPAAAVSCLVELFLHAAKQNSGAIIERLTDKYRDKLDFSGFIPRNGFETTTFLDFALIADAPRVAAHLMRVGCNYSHFEENYPDQTPLHLALARLRSSSNSQRELNLALRIACNYALPRTARVFLACGADANTVAVYGPAAIHITVGRRQRWQKLDEFLCYLGDGLKWHDGRLNISPPASGVCEEDNHSSRCNATGWLPYIPTPASLPASHKQPLKPNPRASLFWHRRITGTIAALLDFGADPVAPIETSFNHKCDHGCWKSVNCNPRGQTPLHMAAARGVCGAIALLVSRGADPFARNADGHTPLYTAISQGEFDAVRRLLDYAAEANPVVHYGFGGRTTRALHAASRFAFPRLVAFLLDRGVDPDDVDARKRTPMHEVLANNEADREGDMIETLELLWDAGASLDIRSSDRELVTPREMGRAHGLPGVREMFHVDHRQRYRLGMRPVEYRDEGGSWGDEGYNANLSRGSIEVQEAFPSLPAASSRASQSQPPVVAGAWGTRARPGGGLINPRPAPRASSGNTQPEQIARKGRKKSRKGGGGRN